MSISTREAKQSYHPKGYGVSEGLKRARAPFRTRNAIVGLGLSGFMFSVYLYSIRAVAQDDFADLQPPTEEQRRNRESLKASQFEMPSLPSPSSLSQASSPDALLPSQPTPETGILGRVRGAFGGRGTNSKLVWAAPPVDNLGRIQRAAEAPITRRIV
jgi:cytochrome c oxidase assembly factor 3